MVLHASHRKMYEDVPWKHSVQCRVKQQILLPPSHVTGINEFDVPPESLWCFLLVFSFWESKLRGSRFEVILPSLLRSFVLLKLCLSSCPFQVREGLFVSHVKLDPLFGSRHFALDVLSKPDVLVPMLESKPGVGAHPVGK